MDLKRQIKSLRDTALQLSLTSGGVWHAEYGVRGSVVRKELTSPQVTDPENGITLDLDEEDYLRERHGFARVSQEWAFTAFMKRFLCTEGQVADVIEEPWRTFGFSFSAASSRGVVPAVEQEEKLDGIGHSFIYGSRESMDRLARMVAFPAAKYLANLSGNTRARDHSWGCPRTALGEWVYILYEVGLKVLDPNLRRYYRHVTALRGGQGTPLDDDILAGFDDNGIIMAKQFKHPRIWRLVWTAAIRRELAFARLGTDLVLASRIALDHLLDLNAEEVGSEVFAKWRKRIASRLNDTERFTLQAAAEHASEDRPLPTQEIAGKAGYDVNSNYKTTLAGLVKMGLLENNGRGYFLPNESAWILEACGGQDQGQD